MPLIFRLILLFSALFIQVQAQDIIDDPEQRYHFFMQKAKGFYFQKNPNYKEAIKYYKKAMAIDSTQADLHYFLAHAYDRLNAKDGNFIPTMQDELVQRASDALNRCLAINPIYMGEKLVLDPYSKLSSVWGSLGLKYLALGKLDTVKAVLEAGKSQGAFPDALLEYHRQALKQLPDDAVLLSSGDNMTYPLLYVQAVENVRPDVAVVDVNLLNADWYPLVIKKLYPDLLSQPEEQIQNTRAQFWTKKKQYLEFYEPVEEPQPPTLSSGFFGIGRVDSTDIEDWYEYGYDEDYEEPELLFEFSWDLKPTIYNDSAGYLLRGDRILLLILGNALYDRPFCHTLGFMDNKRLSLDEHFIPEGLYYRFTFTPTDLKTQREFRKNAFKNMMDVGVNELETLPVQHSEDLVRLLNFYRLGYIETMDLHRLGRMQKRKESLRVRMVNTLPKEVLPYYPKDLMNRLGL